MRSGARLGIDRNGTGSDHGLDRDTVVSEARRAGFELIEQYDFVKPDGMDYLVFGSIVEMRRRALCEPYYMLIPKRVHIYKYVSNNTWP